MTIFTLIAFHKKLYRLTSVVLLLILSLLAFEAKAQCPTGNVLLFTQADVDQFKNMYPDCTELPGNLFAGGLGDINNLNGLSNLVSVGGFVRIEQTISLLNLDGLSSLQHIGGFLSILENSNLSNLDGLSSLQSIDGSFDIGYNYALANIDALSSLQSVGKSLSFRGNPVLTTLDGLSSLQSIGGNLRIEANASLYDISGLSNIDPATISIVAGTGLRIVENNILSICHLPNICTYLSYDPVTHPRTIFSNVGHCITEQTLINACETPPVCPLGTQNFTLQAHLNRFLEDYPDCTEIAGTLLIGGEVSDLSPLRNIKKALSNVTIVGSSITNVDSLSRLTSVGGFLNIVNNSSLTNIDGFYNLTNIGKNLTIRGNTLLADIDGFSGLTDLGQFLWFENNSSLAHVDGLSSLTGFDGDVFFIDNALMGNIQGIQNIDPAKIKRLTIQNNPALSACNMPNICSYLQTSKPRTIENNTGDCLDEAAIINACGALPECPPGSLIFTTQAQLDQFLADYPNCTEIAGNLAIVSPDITDLGPLRNIEKVLFSVSIVNTGISNVDSLSGLHDIGTYLIIQDNASLTNLNGLRSLTKIDGHMGLVSNISLTDIDGLSGLTSIGNYLHIEGNTSLTNVNSLSGITSVGGFLFISNNASLTNLDGLNSLISVAGLMGIDDNAVLNSIQGLKNVDPDKIIELYIRNNPVLPVCNMPNICAYLQTSKPRTIDNNSGNCMDEEAVTAACILSIDDIDNALLSFYPNPVFDWLNISCSKLITSVEVTDLIGDSKLRIKVNSSDIRVDMSSVPQGMYLVKINAGGQARMVKVVKQ